MSQKVTVTIDPKTNEVKYEVEGVMGGSCTDITEALLKGNEHMDTQFTEEYCVPEELPDYVQEELDGFSEGE